jgi:hypothetical protein
MTIATTLHSKPPKSAQGFADIVRELVDAMPIVILVRAVRASWRTGAGLRGPLQAASH